MACVIASPSSNSGKTILSIMLASWARKKNLNIQSFKVGPDYLDTQILTKISSNPCRNLDLILCGKEWVKDSFHGYGGDADLAFIEGVMGLYDGIGSSSQGSTAQTAKVLGLPIVLIVEAKGQAASLAALIKVFKEFHKGINIAGVVLNKVNSFRHKYLLEEVLEGIGIKIFGCLPENEALKVESQSLGLIPASQIIDIENKIDIWAKVAEEYLDLKSFKKLLKPPEKSRPPIVKLLESKEISPNAKKLPIAIANDQAFHFKYKETEEILEALGMPVVYWSPLKDEKIPNKCKGLILPGGFPENFAEELSRCKQSINSIRDFYLKKPIYAECGGMLFLGHSITNRERETYKLAGLLPFHAREGKLKVGYKEIKCLKESPVVEKGMRYIGHEFHRWEIVNNHKNSYIVENGESKTENIWELNGYYTETINEGFCNKRLHASWIHLHWGSSAIILNKWRKSITEAVI